MQILAAISFKAYHEVETVVTRRLITRDKDCYQQGMEILDPQPDECLKYGGDYVEN
jgi:hypothetical protein